MGEHSLTSRIIGFAGSLVLTLASFLIFFRPDFFHLDTNGNITLVLALAILQCTVQSIFFLHILSEKGPRWSLLAYASTLPILFIVIFFSMWIMNHLKYNMML